MQTVEKVRETKETKIALKFNPKGSGKYKISTGFNFLNHMLEQFTYHGSFDLELNAQSLDCDSHHIVEDIAITLGKAFLESKKFPPIISEIFEKLSLIKLKRRHHVCRLT